MALKLQFSLRWMFFAIVVVAIIAAEAVAFPGWFALVFGLVVTSFLVPALVAGIVYSRRSARAFCIGAVAWLLAARWMLDISCGAMQNLAGGRFSPTLLLQSILMPANSGMWNDRTIYYDHSIVWSLAILSGVIAVFIRWLTLGKSSGEEE